MNHVFIYRVTVGASDINDILASFSNYGECVDIIGPVSVGSGVGVWEVGMYVWWRESMHSQECIKG